MKSSEGEVEILSVERSGKLISSNPKSIITQYTYRNRADGDENISYKVITQAKNLFGLFQENMHFVPCTSQQPVQAGGKIMFLQNL
jgi:hypothetical protein